MLKEEQTKRRRSLSPVLELLTRMSISKTMTMLSEDQVFKVESFKTCLIKVLYVLLKRL